ncbi:hypothetical protein HAX54_031279 [Datura stramonium]|uniref:Uncharacterized protein n=1 Tax=Datura stramonium TaxID=4076 RepID=A0ABS8VB10_DATST|nr:hypothetical protein [Datura stramonium]
MFIQTFGPNLSYFLRDSPRFPRLFSCGFFLINGGVLVGWWFEDFQAWSGASLPFSSLTTMLYRQATAHQEVRNCMLGCYAPFNPLSVKGVLGRAEIRGRLTLKITAMLLTLQSFKRERCAWKGRNKRKANSEDNSDAPDSDRSGSSRPTRPFQRMEADLEAI